MALAFRKQTTIIKKIGFILLFTDWEVLRSITFLMSEAILQKKFHGIYGEPLQMTAITLNHGATNTRSRNSAQCNVMYA